MKLYNTQTILLTVLGLSTSVAVAGVAARLVSDQSRFSLEQKLKEFDGCMAPAAPEGMQIETTSFDKHIGESPIAEYSAIGIVRKAGPKRIGWEPAAYFNFYNGAAAARFFTPEFVPATLSDLELNRMTAQLQRCNKSLLGILPATVPTR